MQETGISHLKDTLRSDIESAWSQAWDDGNVDALDGIVSQDYVRRLTNSGLESGIDEVKDEILKIREALPDLHTSIDRILVEGDSAAVYWHSTGTFTEALNGVPPTGGTVETYGSNLLTIREGKVVSEDVTWDATQLLNDLGLPSLASAFEEHTVDPVVDNLDGTPHREMLKAFNRQFVSGVTVVSVMDETGTPKGLAVSSYNSVSLDPPLVLFCVQKTSSTYPSLFRGKHLGINILSCEQRETLGVFASKDKDKFARVPWHEGPNGSPLIDGSAAAVEVEVKERFQALTHTVFIGRVVHAETSEDEPIIYKAGKFFDSRNLDPLD